MECNCNLLYSNILKPRSDLETHNLALWNLRATTPLNGVVLVLFVVVVCRAISEEKLRISLGRQGSCHQMDMCMRHVLRIAGSVQSMSFHSSESHKGSCLPVG